MTIISDVSPTHSNTNVSSRNHSVIGRMLSLACSPDGQSVYVGSYSNLWASDDAGRTFSQLTWPQPPNGQYDAPGALGGWGVVDIAVAQGWRVEKHPRCLARLTPSGFTDIVGFGDSGVWTALGNGAGDFQPPNVVMADFGYDAGGWTVDQHPRFVVDLTGDGVGDIVGFGDAGVWTALGNGDGTFQPAKFVLANFGVQQGWQVGAHPRFVLPLTGSGHADIIAFGDAGVWVALGNGDGTFQNPNYVLAGFGVQQGWQVAAHPRFVAALTGGGHPAIVGFGDAGVATALGNGDGTFQPANFVLADFGVQQGWQVGSHPRFVAPLTPSGHADIVGFGDAGVWTALGNGDGTFRPANFVLANLGVQQGWRVDRHPRFVASLRGNGQADLVGFGDAGVWTALSNGDGSFSGPNFVLANLGFNQGWQVDRHPRFVQSLAGAGGADIVGFGDAGVWTAMGDRQGAFAPEGFVRANFGYGDIVLAITVNDLAAGSRGVWRSTDGGANWTQAHQFPAGESAGELQWALGSDHLVYAAGGSSLAISKNAGTTFTDVFPWDPDPAKRVNHVAVWQNAPADPYPAVIYALGEDTIYVQGKPTLESTMFLSFDGGDHWFKDQGTPPSPSGGAVDPVANGNTPRMIVISPRFPLSVYLLRDGSGGGYLSELWLGDYTHFPFGDRTSAWVSIPVPNPLDDKGNPQQDSGNVFIATTQRGRGDLLFLGAQRYDANDNQPLFHVGPLTPSSASDWRTLDQTIHVDLHGFLLSPDFAATLTGGNYRPTAGTAWILSDGGVYWSTDGGQHFNDAQGVTSLSSINVAGVSAPGKGPALSLNSGDNDGFYSVDGGQHWAYQEYGGGDNDCSYADPLRSNAIMVFTPRWDSAGNYTTHHQGQTVAVYQTSPGNLPDARPGGGNRLAVTGPPLAPPPSSSTGDIWNGLSGYGSRGSRPIVHSLAGETAPAQGDYVFIRFASDTQSLVVRTQTIHDIVHRDQWVTTATGPGQGAEVYLQGPPLPLTDISVLQTSGGHAATVFYVGGDASSGLWTWTEGAAGWTRLVPGPGANSAVRFFVDPYRPNLIYILDSDGVKRSDDGGANWTADANLEKELTWNRQIALQTNDNTSGVGDHFDLVLTDMQFDPNDGGKRFAVGQGGAFYTFDGVNWTRLLHTGALPGRPANCYYDWITDPNVPALYVAFAGRSLVKITDLPQPTIF
ncbi:MAG TPA: hypothetical protein VKQ54_15945 [Caulobacteraceae bacterium]|nr:hypothetical protein [Caulobacteraceae bacterium]